MVGLVDNYISSHYKSFVKITLDIPYILINRDYYSSLRISIKESIIKRLEKLNLKYYSIDVIDLMANTVIIELITTDEKTKKYFQGMVHRMISND